MEQLDLRFTTKGLKTRGKIKLPRTVEITLQPDSNKFAVIVPGKMPGTEWPFPPLVGRYTKSRGLTTFATFFKLGKVTIAKRKDHLGDERPSLTMAEVLDVADDTPRSLYLKQA